MTASADDFRAGMRRLAASVCVITTADGRGERYGLTATAVTSVSVDPPTLLCCLNRASRTFAPLTASGVFAINLMSVDDHAVAHAFAGDAPSARKFSVGEWDEGSTGAPVLRGAFASFECRISQVLEVGTHGLVIGSVDAVRTADAATRALLYADGGYGVFTLEDMRRVEGAA